NGVPPGKVAPPPPVPPQPKPKDKLSLDENPFPEPPGSSDPRSKSLQAFQSFWEKNIGSLEEMPEVKKALFDLLSGDGFDFDMTDENGNSFWDFLNGSGADGSSFGDFFSGGNWDFGGWDFSGLGLGDWFSGWGGGSSSGGSSSGGGFHGSGPKSGSSGGGGGFGFGDGSAAWIPFAILGVAILAVFIWIAMKNMRGREATAAYATEGLGPWPVDPRSINTREDVVK